MKVLNYKYVKPNEVGVVEELERSGYMTQQYIAIMQDWLQTFSVKGRVAFLYAGGVLLPASEARNVTDNGQYREEMHNSGACIRETAAYSMHRWIGSLNGKEYVQYANINGNTCASSMYSLYEAEQLLNSGYDEVVIVAEEKTSFNTLRIFDEMGIDIKVGEGCAIIHLGKAEGPADEDIINTKVWYEYNRNPFAVTEDGYQHVMTDADFINPHGTGTKTNEDAECFYTKPQLRYKEHIGHTQGVSGLLEVCMVLDESIDGKVLCVASGLGGFYASCIVQK